MNIKILGTRCPKCIKLEMLVNKIVDELNLDAVVEKVQDIDEIMSYGVLMTPGLVINEQLKIAGKVPSTDQIKNWILEVN